MLALIVGIIVAAIGIWGVKVWFPDFIMVLKGSIPALLVCGGLLAIIAGITSIKDAMEAKKLEAESKETETKK